MTGGIGGGKPPGFSARKGVGGLGGSKGQKPHKLCFHGVGTGGGGGGRRAQVAEFMLSGGSWG